MSEEPVRLSKIMAQRGLCSRREADELIARGLVRVEGVIVDQLGSKVIPGAVIEILSEGRRDLEAKVTILLNKPKGYVSSQPENGYQAAVELVRAETQASGDPRPFDPRFLRGLAPAGRLDIDSQGLLVLTQDGVIARQLIGENSNVDKEYIVRVGVAGLSNSDRDDAAKRLSSGRLMIEGRQLKPARVEWINDDQMRFILREGMKRQIRKMCEAVGLHVTGLKRVRIGKITLGKLPEGQWRLLRPNEHFG